MSDGPVSESAKRHFARAPRRGVPATPQARLAMLARLHADERYLVQLPRTKHVLAVAVREHADASGAFWAKTRTLADAAGVSRSTVVRALRDAVEAGLVTREPYLRPDGTQGSTTYFLDLALAHADWPTRWVTADSACPPDTWANGRQGGSPVTQRQGGSPVTHLNGSELGKPLDEEERLRSEGSEERARATDHDPVTAETDEEQARLARSRAKREKGEPEDASSAMAKLGETLFTPPPAKREPREYDSLAGGKGT